MLGRFSKRKFRVKPGPTHPPTFKVILDFFNIAKPLNVYSCGRNEDYFYNALFFIGRTRHVLKAHDKIVMFVHIDFLVNHP